ncbi:hypothetical protein HERIO_575 [Hepatospora eriocheir]|uniref:Uncharacterized protein n=1 Tax=Hepatospora eriocheir TaxID=1081669 RepID=A0A1X0QD04_9MICR|nr:hypothetical protein HERIO_575 [Hepatospora eriocheir]
MNYLLFYKIINIVTISASINFKKKLLNLMEKRNDPLPDDLRFFILGDLLVKILFGNNHINFLTYDNPRLISVNKKRITIKFIDESDVKIIYNECANSPSDVYKITTIKEFIKLVTIIKTPADFELYNYILKRLQKNLIKLLSNVRNYRVHRCNNEFYEKAALAIILEEYPKLFNKNKMFFEYLINIIRDGMNYDDVFPNLLDSLLKNNPKTKFSQQEKDTEIENFKYFTKKLRKEYLSIIDEFRNLPTSINRKKILNEIDIQIVDNIIQAYFSNKTKSKKKDKSNVISVVDFLILIKSLFQNYVPFYYLVNQINIDYD